LKIKTGFLNFNSSQWPQEALISVSMRFLNIMSVIPAGIKGSVAQFMAYVHGSVNEISKVITVETLFTNMVNKGSIHWKTLNVIKFT
jgi:hypothetical protein